MPSLIGFQMLFFYWVGYTESSRFFDRELWKILKTWVNHLQGQDREEIIVLKVVLVWLDCKLLFMDLISTMLNWSSYILAADHVAIWVRFYLNEAFNFGSFIVSWREKSKSARKSGFRVEFWKPVWCNRLEIQAQWAHKFEKNYDPS